MQRGGTRVACSRSVPSSRATIAFGEEFLYELKAGPAAGLRPGNDTTELEAPGHDEIEPTSLHLRTRKVRWVTPAPSITRVRSRSSGPVPRWSNKLTPPPSKTGTRSRWIS